MIKRYNKVELYDMKIEVDYLPLGIITLDVLAQQNKDPDLCGNNTIKIKLFESQ